jgi:hypothetical protein
MAWGNAAKVHIKKLLILQKRVLRLMYFKSFDNHTIPLFVSSNSLPINMMYIKESANMLYDINQRLANSSTRTFQKNICGS